MSKDADRAARPSGAETAVPTGGPLVFLLSPASLRGVRGRRIVGGREGPGRRDASETRRGDDPGDDTAPVPDPAAVLHSGGAVPLGHVYAHISSLYYRGKRAYARRFGRRLHGDPVLAITSTRGLVPDSRLVDLTDLEAFARQEIDPDDPAYLEPLRTSSRALLHELTRDPERAPGYPRVVLLGSIATRKYLDPLVAVFGERLWIPREFVGRGDMSRGGLLLRAARSGRELELIPARGARRHGSRPPRLPRRS
ncbi:MAG: hypothetical protein P8188_03125 [Gemmatimonadota bacterium]